MNVTDVASNIGRSANGPGIKASDELRVGQVLKIQVLERHSEHQYTVQLRDQRLMAESQVPLELGTEARVVIEATGERIRVRLASNHSPADSPEATPASRSLQALEARYRTSLSPAAHEALWRSSEGLPNPTLWHRAGLYLHKLGLASDESALAAIYEAQGGANARTAPSEPEREEDLGPLDPAADIDPIAYDNIPLQVSLRGRVDFGTSVLTSDSASDVAVAESKARGVDLDAGRAADPIALTMPSDLEPLCEALEEAFDEQFDPSASEEGDGASLSSQGDPAGDSGGDSPSQRELAHKLLNVPDGGAVQYRYATLPLLVRGTLVELDLALFQQRHVPAHGTNSRRLELTLQTEQLGPIRLAAQATDSRLALAMSGATPQALTVLETVQPRVRARLERLGWAVERVQVQIDPAPKTAARSIVDHVLNAGSLDQRL
jgi:Flagellar hook-length control protein FliK